MIQRSLLRLSKHTNPFVPTSTLIQRSTTCFNPMNFFSSCFSHISKISNILYLCLLYLFHISLFFSYILYFYISLYFYFLYFFIYIFFPIFPSFFFFFFLYCSYYVLWYWTTKTKTWTSLNNNNDNQWRAREFKWVRQICMVVSLP